MYPVQYAVLSTLTAKYIREYCAVVHTPYRSSITSTGTVWEPRYDNCLNSELALSSGPGAGSGTACTGGVESAPPAL